MLSRAVVMLAAMWMLCAQAAAQDAPAAEQPTTRPGPDTVLATVGKEKITAKDVDRMFMRRINQMAMRMRGQPLPPDRLEAEWKRTLARMIDGKLISAHLVGADCPTEALTAKKLKMASEARTRYNMPLDRYMAALGMTEADLIDDVKLEKLMAGAVTPAKVEALIKASPERFDGTSVQASHILIACDATASDDVQDAARKLLADLSEQIRSGKIKFEDAAKAHSTCPSKERGGDLGPFTFERMVVPFSETAFSMKEGDLSGIVQSQFGLHLIKVTNRTAGSGKAGPKAKAAAGSLLQYRLRQEILARSRKANPVVIVQ